MFIFHYIVNYFAFLADYAMSPETVIVGDGKGVFLYGGDYTKKNARMKNQHPVTAAVALLFMRDKDKPHGTAFIYAYIKTCI